MSIRNEQHKQLFKGRAVCFNEIITKDFLLSHLRHASNIFATNIE